MKPPVGAATEGVWLTTGVCAAGVMFVDGASVVSEERARTSATVEITRKERTRPAAV